MSQNQRPFRFNHREITVIGSLFVFTSLLMFTVGIVVGKSLAQSKTTPSQELASAESDEHEPSAKETHNPGAPHQAKVHPEGTSVSTDSPSAKHETKETPSHLESVAAKVSEPSAPPPGDSHGESRSPHDLVKDEKHNPKTEPLSANDPLSTPDLELIPEKPRTGDARTTLADLADSDEVQKALKNPKLQSILENEEPGKQKSNKRHLSSMPAKISTPPKSFAEGKYTVQVGSYPSQADATLRLEQLRKQGFPFAYMSTKELGEQKEPWYRVWLGYFPNAESAKAGGELLQQRGEVKSYLVRKSENADD